MTITALIAAAQEFCQRVEAGEVRSKRSYAAFKEALSDIPLIGEVTVTVDIPSNTPMRESGDRPYPCLLSDEENDTLIKKAKNLWHALEENMLGGFSDENRPIFIFQEFKEVIEKYGNRDVGLKWSKDELDKTRKTNNQIEVQKP